jgi:hypothetical protein
MLYFKVKCMVNYSTINRSEHEMSDTPNLAGLLTSLKDHAAHLAELNARAQKTLDDLRGSEPPSPQKASLGAKTGSQGLLWKLRDAADAIGVELSSLGNRINTLENIVHGAQTQVGLASARNSGPPAQAMPAGFDVGPDAY